MRLPGVVLAAGRSTRMGRDKALLPIAGETFVERLARIFLGQLAPVVVVAGHHGDQVAQALAGRVRVVVNEDYDRGMLSSLQTGLRAVPAEAEAAVFTLVDHPSLRAETLRALLRAYGGEALGVPRYRGERGHPVILRRDVIDELLALEPTASPKPVVRARYGEALFVDLDDAAIVEDVDTPERYEALHSRESTAD